MTVNEFILELRQVPDPEHTLVVLSAGEIDEPGVEFVALDEFVREAETWYEKAEDS